MYRACPRPAQVANLLLSPQLLGSGELEPALELRRKQLFAAGDVHVPGSAAQAVAAGASVLGVLQGGGVGSGAAGAGSYSPSLSLEWKRAQSKKGATQDSLWATHNKLEEQMRVAQQREKQAHAQGQSLVGELQQGLMEHASQQAQQQAQQVEHAAEQQAQAQQAGAQQVHAPQHGQQQGGPSKRIL